MYEVRVSATFAKQFRALPKTLQRRIRAGLQALAEDPLTARAGADIKLLRATQPRKHRLRVGDHRIVYAVESKQVNVIEVFARERGYRE